MPDRTFGRRRTLNGPAREQPAAPVPTERTQALGRLAADEAASDGERSNAVDRVRAATVATSPTAGWDGFDSVAMQMGVLDAFLKITEDPQIIHFLDRDPVDVFVCHWLDEIEEGSKSIRCIGKETCPLCGIGDKATKFSACFNVLSLENPDKPQLKVWECGIKISRQLRDIAQDDKRGPLDRIDVYFAVSKKQKTAKNVEYHLERVKARDLEEEYGITPLAEKEINRFLADRYTDEIKPRLSVDELQEIASFVMNGY